MLSLIYFTFILDFNLYYITFKFFNVKRKLNLPFKVKLILFSFFTVVVYFMLEKTYYHFSTFMTEGRRLFTNRKDLETRTF